MTPEEYEQKEEKGKLSQARMMVTFRQSKEFQFLNNSVEALKLVYWKKRQMIMESPESKDVAVKLAYLSGKEDMAKDFFEAIYKTISTGEEIKTKNELIEAYREGWICHMTQ